MGKGVAQLRFRNQGCSDAQDLRGRSPGHRPGDSGANGRFGRFKSSTFTWLKGQGDFEKPGEPPACREGAAGGDWGTAAATSISASGSTRWRQSPAEWPSTGNPPVHGTFFTFADYMRPSIRLAALMGLRVIYVFTHDSIGVGEDGPTHQPIEQLMSLRAIPHMTLIRPADANETVEAWRAALLNTSGPTALIFTRQNLSVLDRSVVSPAAGLRKGGYILWESAAGNPDVILIGTGSEVEIALEAGRKLASEGVRVRVVSLPSWELFDREPQAYRDSVLPPPSVYVCGRAGIRLGWEHYVGLEERSWGSTVSAPAPPTR